ncbi:MAG: PD40 domain-containing protein, partial [Proteobacteria bacterium]|nr:PD40 domain-containing protein [Pseudomonadota bacterium]
MRAGQRSLALLVFLLALVCSRGAEAGTTRRVSVTNEGAQTFYDSWNPVVSADGHYVAFESLSRILVDGDTNEAWDIFVWDRLKEEVTRVSVGLGGTQVNGDSRYPAISWDGRYVAFQSRGQVFVHDRAISYTSQVSVTTGGMGGDGPSSNPAISADGRYVAFHSSADNLDPLTYKPGAYVHDRATGETVRVSISSNGFVRVGGGDPAISGDGLYVAFVYADIDDDPELVANDQNRASDVFVHDRSTGYTLR